MPPSAVEAISAPFCFLKVVILFSQNRLWTTAPPRCQMRIDVKLVLSNFCSRHLVEGCLTIETGMLFAQATLQLIFTIERGESVVCPSSFAVQFQNSCYFSNSAALHRAQLFFHQISSKLPNFLGGIFRAGDAAV